ncbi:hypothetical protein EYZ11_010343 [Aspergillus tanneri]|uniref:Uncharacterized protein n=1 Tax=Aspergillus tanneri TaxID=1220188 RepID=A0A4S3J5L8_9EURO|nr:hypothetical protein EYZ11_010343 [Aspergillus tanneri]
MLIPYIAGIPLEQIAGSNTSVFAGVFFKDYNDSLMRDPDRLPRYLLTGNGSAMASNRISHFFDLRGASMTVDTGCSTTLTALHLACQSLRAGESNISIVGGANLLLNPEIFDNMTSLGFLSPEGRSFAFDSRATGYGRGEGIATVILKPLEDALRDNDPVRAVIRHTAINQDGRTPTLTSPSQDAQIKLIRSCYRDAGLHPSQTDYVEAHGTGTQAGDVVEAGSVKSNIGHTEAASGLAAVIKVVMGLEKRCIPPNANFETPNPKIPMEEWKIKSPATPYRVFLLSAKEKTCVQAMASNLVKYLKDVASTGEDEEEFLSNLAYTLGERRSFFQWTAAYPASTRAQLISALEDNDNSVGPAQSSETQPRVGFVFTGQGAQWYAMGRELIQAYHVFRAALVEADDYVTSFGAEWSLIDELMRDMETSNVNHPSLSLPLCTALQIALVELLRSWGITPVAVTGHSSGEVAAAYAAGAIDFKSAMKIVFFRGALATRLGERRTSETSGGMLAAGLSHEDADRYIAKLTMGTVVVACINSPNSVTISGDLAAIEEIEALLVADGIFARRLKVGTAYHSHHMQAVADDYLASLQKNLGTESGVDQTVPFYSSVTGERIEPVSRIHNNPEHWVKSMVQPVYFQDSFTNMCTTVMPGSAKPSQNVDIILEVGPHNALAGPIRQILTLPTFQGMPISYTTCLVRNENAVETMQKMACTLLRKGRRVNLHSVNFPTDEQHLRVLFDLPSYPWNHQTGYWIEPRASKERKLRSHGPSDLIGCLLTESNSLTPTWTHRIRALDIPWLQDHRVQSEIIYPAAGLICMAIEAMTQTQGSKSRDIAGFKFRDIDIMTALAVPDDGVEVQFSLRPGSDKTLWSNDWQQFSIYSLASSETWVENCKGFISATFVAPDDSSKDGPQGEDHVSQRLQFDSDSGVYTRRVQPSDVYRTLQSAGIHHGPAFQNLLALRGGQGQSLGTFTVAASKAASPTPSHQQHQMVLHPTTLDSVFQAAYAALSPHDLKTKNAMIPRSVKSMFVSSNISREPGHVFKAHTALQRYNSQGFTASVTVVSDRSDTDLLPQIEIEGLRFQSMGGGVGGEEDPRENRGRTFLMKWAPDISCNRLATHLKGSLHLTWEPSTVDIIMDIRRACFHFIHNACQSLSEADILQLNWHQKRFYDWMKLQVQPPSLNGFGRPRGTSHGEILDNADQEVLFKRVSAASVNGQMVCRMGHNLASILRNQIAPLELMVKDSLLHTYYAKGLRWKQSYVQIKQLVELFAHKHPRARVLEIGAGTGGCTEAILEAFRTGDNTQDVRLAHYDFTDISPAFFDKARQKLSQWRDFVSYKALDIEKDPAEQGFECTTYDLVIASQVLHATKAMDQTMSNVRKLLKPGGRLLIIECTRDELELQLIFGPLSGWWLGQEEDRQLSPSLTIDAWNSVLLRTGFSGVEFEVPDNENRDLYSLSVMMSSARLAAPTFHPQILIVHDGTPPPDWLNSLRASIQSVTTFTPQVEHLKHAVGEDKVCIFVSEVEWPLLAEPSKEEFLKLKDLTTRARGLLWLSSGGVMACERPQSSLHTGLLRTLRCEYNDKRYVSLDLDPTSDLYTPASIGVITDVFKRSFDSSRDPTLLDFECAERLGMIYIPRVFPVPEEETNSPNNELHPRLEAFYQPDWEQRLAVQTPGLLSSLGFSEIPVDAEEPFDEDMIEIEPRAFGLNFRDVMIAMGQLNEEIMGFECSGVITRVGTAASLHQFKVGDRVCALLRGHWANTVRVHWTSVCQIPNSMSFEIAASIPMAFTTAYYALHTTAHLQTGERVLIHCAAGGVGQAAIMLAQRAGAEVFVTLGSAEKRRFITETYNIPDDHIFSSRDPSFSRAVMAMTEGRGVDVLLNSLAGELLQESLNCLAPFGRFVEIGKRDLQQNNYLEMGPFIKNITFAAIDLIAIGTYRGPDVARILADVIALFEENALQPVQPVTPYPLSQVKEAFRQMQAGKHMGKIVVVPTKDDRVKMLSLQRPIRLIRNATYLIVGGLGGIGRSVCQWMVDHGARHLVLISRSAGTQNRDQSFQDSVQRSGAVVRLLSCDIANPSQLKATLDECKESMPPIRGVIHSAMVLRDSIFDDMSVEQYQAAVSPKVQGTWNLHQLLSETYLDFFIMLSSLAGVTGNTSQANYTVGGTFQDAIARHRSARGMPATSLDLGMVQSVGYVAETEGIAPRLERMGFEQLDEAEVLGLVESAIRMPRRKLADSQIITGIASTAAGLPNAFWSKDAKFAGLSQQAQRSAAAPQRGESWAMLTGSLTSQLVGISSSDGKVDLLCTIISQRISEMFLVPEEDIKKEHPLTKYGLDSLVAVEIRNWLVSLTQTELTTFDILQSPSLEALANKVLQKIMARPSFKQS